MGLFQRTFETYENHRDLIGIYDSSREPLAPISHIITNAGIEITLDVNGCFKRAETVNKNASKIIIPVTEESSGRTSGVCPHPLCDNIGYISSNNSEKYDAYVEQLEDWEASPYSHPMLTSILKYVKGKTILEDLSRSDIKIKDEKIMICWRVIGIDSTDSECCWENKKLYDSYIKYYESKRSDDEKSFCMVTGKQTIKARQHLKGVVALNGNAKLISANDTINFTYRGRFKDADQAVTVGYEASQKAHNALKWLSANQGVIIGGRTFLCWNPQGKELPSIRTPFKPKKEQHIVVDNYKEDLEMTLYSYKSNFNPSDNAVVAVFDAATTGRLSVTYYNEMFVYDFLENLKQWDETCCFNDNRYGIISPSLDRIINCAFGTERDKAIEADDKILKQHIQRILVCRVEGTRIPLDIVQALAEKTKNLLAYSGDKRDDLTFTACAVIRKYYLDYKQEEYKMALEKEKNDISYQYGRLLAVLEKAERDTYDKSESRDPNAIRMQSVYCNRPLQTAKILIEQIKNGYYHKLKSGSKMYYESLIGEIYEKISNHSESEWDLPLKETYIIGYYLQKNALYTKNENKNDINESEESNND